MAMNPEIKAQWVAALRSGDYVQGRNYLRNRRNGEVKHCCLGVLADLGVEAGVVQRDDSRPGGASDYLSPGAPNRYSLLPAAVMDWSGIETSDAQFDLGPEAGLRLISSLASKNDSGATFEEIAAIIEEKF